MIGDILIVLIVAVVWLGLVALLIRGWRNRGKRQEDSIGTIPTVPDNLGSTILGPDTGLYLGATFAPSWQNRVAVGDFGDRAAASATAHAGGIAIARKGASTIWIPRASITAIRTERGHAGKVMTADGVLVIRWTLPSGTEIDSGLRADDKSSYRRWITEFTPTPATEEAGAPDSQPDQTESGSTPDQSGSAAASQPAQASGTHAEQREQQ